MFAYPDSTRDVTLLHPLNRCYLGEKVIRSECEGEVAAVPGPREQLSLVCADTPQPHEQVIPGALHTFASLKGLEAFTARFGRERRQAPANRLDEGIAPQPGAPASRSACHYAPLGLAQRT